MPQLDLYFWSLHGICIFFGFFCFYLYVLYKIVPSIYKIFIGRKYIYNYFYEKRRGFDFINEIVIEEGLYKEILERKLNKEYEILKKFFVLVDLDLKFKFLKSKKELLTYMGKEQFYICLDIFTSIYMIYLKELYLNKLLNYLIQFRIYRYNVFHKYFGTKRSKINFFYNNISEGFLVDDNNKKWNDNYEDENFIDVDEEEEN